MKNCTESNLREKKKEPIVSVYIHIVSPRRGQWVTCVTIGDFSGEKFSTFSSLLPEILENF